MKIDSLQPLTTLEFKESVTHYVTARGRFLAECCQAILREAGPAVLENLLYHIWERRHFNVQNLTTTDGQPLEILNWGRRNSGPGPDFSGAELRQNGRRRSGAIEMHLNSTDWYQHNHQHDPEYNAVILHVVLWDHPEHPPVRRANGQKIPTLNLSRFLTADIETIRDALIPAAQTVFPCQTFPVDSHTTVFGPVIRQLGERRIAEKRDRFMDAAAANDWDEALYGGIGDALGYDKNREPFRRLTQLVSYARLRTWAKAVPYKTAADLTLQVQAVLLGAAGFLTDENPQADAYRQALSPIWKRWSLKHRVTPMNEAEWRFAGLRPPNYPTRRIAGLAALLVNFLPEGLTAGFLAAFDTDKPLERLYELLETDAGLFWQNHYRLNDPPQSRASAILGQERRTALLINVILPVLLGYAKVGDDNSLSERIRAIYDSLTDAGEHHIGKSFKALWPISAAARPAFQNVLFQQGLIGLHRECCELKLCRRCPLLSPQK